MPDATLVSLDGCLSLRSYSRLVQLLAMLRTINIATCIRSAHFKSLKPQPCYSRAEGENSGTLLFELLRSPEFIDGQVQHWKARRAMLSCIGSRNRSSNLDAAEMR